MNRDIFENAMGYNGFEYIADTDPHTSPSGQLFIALQCITDTVIAAYISDVTIDGTITGVTLPVGTIIYTRLSSITLTSGTLIAYKGI